MRSQKTRTGQAANFNRKWIWADQMEFFKPFLRFATTSSNVKNLEISDQNYSYGESDSQIIYESNLEIDATLPTIADSRKNMYLIVNMFN